MKNQIQLFALVCSLSLCMAAPGLAGDGRIEINQSTIVGTTGYPFTISVPGSYILTGSLDVPASTDGIIIAGDHVVLDLNGFTVSGTDSCTIGNCTAGSADGVATSAAYGFVTVRNGQVEGFSGNCVALDDVARAERLQISHCGRAGIVVGEQSTVIANQILNVGESGISMAGPASVFAHNTINDFSLGPGTYAAVQGGTETAGNYCGDGLCNWVDNRRLYYLTTGTYDGNNADAACSDGFRMASLWELWNVSGLKYDVNRGFTRADSVESPPTDSVGWVETGYNSSGSSTGGQGNCLLWSTNSSKDFGTWMYLNSNWGSTTTTQVSPWNAGAGLCQENNQVWCIEE